MKAMAYLLGKRIKNSLLELIRKPSRLILVLVVFGYLGFTMYTQISDHEGLRIQSYDLSILGTIVLMLMLFFVGLGVAQGFSKGSSIFAMSDVNLAFVSPVKSNAILGFSMIYQAGKVLLLSVAFVSYSFIVNQYFEVNPATTFVMIGCMAGALILSQLLSMCIYILVGGHPKRKLALGILIGVILAAAAGFILYEVLLSGKTPDIMTFWKAGDAGILEWIPFVGWLKGIFMAVVYEDQTALFLFLGMLLLSVAGIFVLLIKSRPDYYEDVLQTTEKTFLRREAVKAGKSFDNSGGVNMGFGSGSEKTPKVRDFGIGRGRGASALFYKQLLELKRSSRFLFFDKTTLSVLLSSLFMLFIMKIAMGAEGDSLSSNGILATAAGMSAYMLLIFNAIGQWSQELMKPYIFLIPEPPFKKLLWATGTSVLKPFFDGVLVFTLLGILAGAAPVTVVCCIGLYVSFGYFFTASNVMSERVFGQAANKGLTLFLYILLVSVLMAPGLVAGIVSISLVPGIPKAVLGAVPLILWNLLIGTLLMFLFRNILHNMENASK